MRKEFEKWAKSVSDNYFPDLSQNGDEGYWGARTDTAWKAWQAAYASRDAEVEFLTKAVHLANDDSEYFRKENEEIKSALLRNGFVQCDIAACNCGGWHARYGLPERMNEIKDALADAGHPLSNENGNLVSRALTELIADRDSCKSEDVKFSNLQSELAAYKAANFDLENLIEEARSEADGCVLVPMFPTMGQIHAGLNIDVRIEEKTLYRGELVYLSMEEISSIYKAMIEAAKGYLK